MSSINILLLEYDIYNVRYSVAKDNVRVLNRIFKDYPFLDSEINFKMDNGIKGTGAFRY
jgi:hypothetical protein